MVNLATPLRSAATLAFRATEWADNKPKWPGLVGAVYLPFVLAGFLLTAAWNADYALLGAVLPGTAVFALSLYGERIAPRRPEQPSLAQRLDALSARAEAAGASDAAADPPTDR